MSWPPRILISALILTALDVIHVVAFFDAAASDGMGFSLYLFHSAAIFAFAAVPIALVLVALELSVGRFLSLPRPEKVAAAVVAVALAAFGVQLTDTNFFHGQHIQFTDRVDVIRGAVQIGVLGIATAAALWWLGPLFGRLLSKLPNLSRPHVLPVVAVALLVLLFTWTIDFGLIAVHLDPLAALFALGNIGLMLMALRLSWAHVGPRARRVGRCVLIALFLFCPIGPWRNPHCRFVLYAHAPAAGALAAGIRDLVDFDGDGASGTWLGGTDCASFDPNRGPSLREIPGDGIDQDCVGGDAAAGGPARTPKPLPLGSCRPPQPPMSMVLITVDALRADAVSSRVAPRLHRFAARSISYSRAYTPATFTHLAFPSLLGSVAVSDLHRRNPLVDEVRCVAEPLAARLARAGYDTAFVNYLLKTSELQRGFKSRNPQATFHDLGPGTILDELTAARVTDDALSFVASRGPRPFFLWMHYLDAHAPYLSPEGAELGDVLDPDYRHDVSDPVAAYERVVTYVDFHLARFLDAIARSPLAERLIIAVSADHGEDLGLRGREGHGPDVFEDTVRVPLVLAVPGCAPQAIDTPVSLTRIGPTLGAFAEPPQTGSRQDSGELPVVAEGLYTSGLISPRRFRRAVIGERYKLVVDVRNGGRMLFDLASDPGESTDLYRALPKQARLMESAYQRWLDRPLVPGIKDCSRVTGETGGD